MRHFWISQLKCIKKVIKQACAYDTARISDYKKVCTKDNRKRITQKTIEKELYKQCSQEGKNKLYNELKTRWALCKLGTVRVLNWSALSVYINNKNCTSNDYETSAGGIVAAWVKYSTRDGHIQPHTHAHLPVSRRPKCQPHSARCQQQACCHAPTNANCRSSPPFETGQEARSRFLGRGWPGECCWQNNRMTTHDAVP